MEQSKLDVILKKHKLWLNQEVGVERANLRGADLRWADLQGADLQGADLRWADLRGADLQGADLQGANLRGADLRDADLQGADLQGADLDFSSLPLWCGGLKMHICEKIAIQALYHLLSAVSFSKHISVGFKRILLTKELVGLANKFHRVKECGEIKAYEDSQ